MAENAWAVSFGVQINIPFFVTNVTAALQPIQIPQPQQILTPTAPNAAPSIYVDMDSRNYHLQECDGHIKLLRLDQVDPSTKKILVNHLAEDVERSDLLSFFSRFGEIQQAKVIVDTRKNRKAGYGFLQFKTLHGAKEAVRLCHGKVFFGRVIGVYPAASSDHISQSTTSHVARIPVEWTVTDLFSYLIQFGTIKCLKLMTGTSGSSRQFGFVTFDQVQSNSAAQSFPGHQHGLVITKLKETGQTQPFAPDFPVFFGNLGQHQDAEFIGWLMGDFEIASLRVMKPGTNSPRNRGFAFVNFVHESDAITAVHRFNGMECGSGLKLVVHKRF